MVVHFYNLSQFKSVKISFKLWSCIFLFECLKLLKLLAVKQFSLASVQDVRNILLEIDIGAL